MHRSILIFAIVATTRVHAAIPLESHARIYAAAEDFARAQAASLPGDTSIKVGRIDSHLRLPQCETALEAFSNGARAVGPTTVGVRCTGARAWSLFVPVHVTQYRSIVVVNAALARGAQLSADQLSLSKRDVSHYPNGYFTDVEAVNGLVARRALAVDTVLTPQHVEPPRLVLRGEHVRISGGKSAIQVFAVGEALADGRAGERVRVKNLRSERIIEALVVGRGVVEVGGFR
jgi:flagella basal body P-ring formation protein FlgA